MTLRLRPLTERILSRFPGPRAAWVLTWALLPWANAGVNLLLDTETSAVWEQRRVLIILNYAALSFAVVITLWGTRGIAERLEAFGTAPFRAINNFPGPLVSTVATAVAFGGSAYVRDGLASGLLRGATAHPRNRVLVIPLDVRLAPTRS